LCGSKPGSEIGNRKLETIRRMVLRGAKIRIVLRGTGAEFPAHAKVSFPVLFHEMLCVPGVLGEQLAVAGRDDIRDGLHDVGSGGYRDHSCLVHVVFECMKNSQRFSVKIFIQDAVGVTPRVCNDAGIGPSLHPVPCIAARSPGDRRQCAACQALDDFGDRQCSISKKCSHDLSDFIR